MIRKNVRADFHERVSSCDSFVIFIVIDENIRDGLGGIERFRVITPVFEFKVGNFRDCRVNGVCERHRICCNLSFIGKTICDREIFYHFGYVIEFASLEFQFPVTECNFRLVTDPQRVIMKE